MDSGLILVKWSSSTDPPQIERRSSTFTRLERIRQAEKLDLIFYFQILERQAREMDGGSRMLEYFYQFKQGKNVALDRLDTELEIFSVFNYSDFNDILFVDTSGYIFHSIKRESDYHTYLKNGPIPVRPHRE